MFFIPGQLISLLTFPGVIVHEWAHEKFCDWFGVKVHEVSYFKFWQKTSGYVVHDTPSTFKQIFWISAGPLVVNSLGCILLSMFATEAAPKSFLYYLFFWLAISVGAHSFPSDHDAKNVLESSKNHIKDGGSLLHYLSYPFFTLIWVANKLRFFWFDFIYAVFLMRLSGVIN